MKKITEYCIYMLTTLVFTACEKQDTNSPVPSETKKNTLNFAEQRSRNLAAIVSKLDSKRFKYNSFVTVKDQSGEYYANYKLYSDDQVTYEKVYIRYKNATLLIQDRDSLLKDSKSFFSENSVNNSASTNDLNSPLIENHLERNRMHLVLLETNVPEEKTSTFSSSVQAKSELLVGGNIFFTSGWNVYGLGSASVTRIVNGATSEPLDMSYWTIEGGSFVTMPYFGYHFFQHPCNCNSSFELRLRLQQEWFPSIIWVSASTAGFIMATD
jgi:hypothetical protein